jgi:hypothetical protein
MSLSFGSGVDTQIASGTRGVAWMVEMDFTTGTVYYTTAPADLVSGGHTYIGLGHLVGVGNLTESADATSTDKLSLQFSIVDSAMVALSLGNIDTYRGRQARLYLQVFDSHFIQIGTKVQRWTGYMDRVVINRQRSDSEGGPSSGKIEMQCSRAGMARSRHAQGLRINHQQQQARFAGDLGLEYVARLIEQPTRWLSKRFQEI